jgi:hypothetical protein
MVTKNDSSDSEPQGSVDDAELIELRRRIVLLRPERRDQLSDWLTDEKRKELSDDHSHTLRIFNNDD